MSIQPVIFRCSCIKTLSAVEANPARSNQHEFNGATQLKSIFGEERQEFSAQFTLRGDSQVFEPLLLSMMPEKHTRPDPNTDSIFRPIESCT